MKKILLLPLLLSGCLFAIDSDMDGVDDAQDQCRNTPFSDLVNASGCTIRSLQSSDHYDIIVGAGYSQINYASQEKADTTTQTLQADYFNGNIWVQLAGSYFQSSSPSFTQSGLGDTLIALYYKSPFDNGFTVQTGVGILLPTYNSGYHNEAIDYQGSINAQYDLSDNTNLFAGYSYTLVNDTNIPNTVQYQNTQSFYAGAGYAFNDATRLSASYAQAQSMYIGTSTIKTASASLFYQLNTHWFTMLDYRYGLSDSASDHDGSVRLGYYF
jgi:predicted porin